MKTYEEGLQDGMKRAKELIEDGRTHCILNDKVECTNCLANLLKELNGSDNGKH